MAAFGNFVPVFLGRRVIMCRKLICLISFVFVSVLVLTSTAFAADPTLVGWWKFEEASGTLYDESDNHNDGTPYNGVLYQQAGQLGYALGFDGSDDYVIMGTTGRPTDIFSFGGWFRTSVEHEIDAQNTSGTGGVSNQRYAFDPQHGGDSNGGAGLSIGTNGISVYEHGSNYMPATAVYEAEIGDDWNHIMIVYDNKQPTIYLNGQAVLTGLSSPRAVVNAPIQLGGMAYGYFEGSMDEVRIYNRVLSPDEIQVLAARPKAWDPDPPNESIFLDTWVTLGWLPGDFAASHDVYLGESFEDVDAGTGDTFRGNQTSLYYMAGFTGQAYPDGLVPGTTYYWRIDEVNDSDPNSPWKGDIWSFTVPPKMAYDPEPADGIMFVDPNIVLGWTGGFGSKLHTVYFGDNFDDVNDATGGPPQAATTYNPGPLEFGKTYYWRVDEFEVPITHKGDVWSFTTTVPGLGTVIMERWNNITSTDINTLKNNPKYPDNPDVTEVLTEFSWDEDLDHYGGRIHGWIYAPGTGDYTFWLCTDDQGELWLSTDDDSSNIKLIAHESGYSNPNSWGSGEEQSDPIPLIGGNKYYIMALWKEHEGGDHCQVAWQGPGVPELVIIPGSNLSPYEPLNAYGARPGNSAVDITQTPVLKWKPGLQAVSHDVYFGADEDAVKNATTASPEYKGTKTLGDESLDVGKLDWESTYYWRVDEVNNLNPESPWVGSVWSFTTAGFAIIDDFEDYDAGDNQIWYSWHDGLGYGVQGSDPYYAGNGTGAAVGDETTFSYTEETIVHGGSKSMPLYYNNNKQGYAKYSEAEKTLTKTRDWTEEGVAELSLWFYGDAGNDSESMYVAVSNSTGTVAVIIHDDPAAATIAAWTEWIIPLQSFADQGIDLTNVDKIAIGLGTRGNMTIPGGRGKVLIDDIRLYRPAP
jgi:hypothetical protein